MTCTTENCNEKAIWKFIRSERNEKTESFKCRKHGLVLLDWLIKHPDVDVEIVNLITQK